MWLVTLFSGNHGEVLTFTFGLSSGLLTLIGLISIFVSINSQHKIQKARELLWDLSEIPYKYEKLDNGLISKEIISKTQMYESILTDKNDITHSITIVVRFSIIIVLLIWATSLLLCFYSFDLSGYIYICIITVICIIIMLCFYKVLGKLNDIKIIGNLPNLTDILDANYSNDGLSTLNLIAISTEIRIRRKKDKYLLSLGFPKKFRNLSISTYLAGFKKADEDQDLFLSGEDYVRSIGDDDYYAHLGSQFYFCDLFEFSINSNYDFIHVQLDLVNEKIGLQVHYDRIPISYFKQIESYGEFYWLPDRLTEHNNEIFKE